jgi:cytochrome c-type biogenesis protein CcmF
MHYTVGNLGHLFVVLSFVASLTASLGYFLSVSADENKALNWRRFARFSFGLHGISVLGIVVSLFYIIYHHYYEYHYAWNYSSNSLPVHFILSTFWNGQEGGFLLWIFWHVILGTALIVTNKTWERPVMAIFMSVQAFLCSMILGVVFFETFKIGSSPFTLLRDVMAEAPVFKSNPEFIPADGQGLNPTLQNYWMIIHPPTLFLGFASTIVPFVFCLAGLWQKKFSEWVAVALPWTLFSACILGIGIMMGAYWAYETLSFGGYWNWDPVENASYIPWLVLVAALHTMGIHKRNGTALKTSIILVISTFILILYATFLIRSGVLSQVSNHSFTDLGLSGQLLLLLGSFTGLSLFLAIKNWKFIPSSQKEMDVYSREFWIFMGVTVLTLASFQVLVYTSIPAVKSLAESLGFIFNIAPPSDQIGFNAMFQIWFGMATAVLSAVGQFVYWSKINSKRLWNSLLVPGLLALLFTLGVIVFAKMKIAEWKYMLLLAACAFSIFANGGLMTEFLRKNYRIAGGSVAHLGIALMLLGILFSAGYSRSVSINRSGLLIFKEDKLTEDGEKANKENTLLWANQPTQMDDYWLTYKGKRMELREAPGYYKKDWFIPARSDYQFVTTHDLAWKGKTYFKKGDTVATYPENTYYEIEYRDAQGRVFSLYPRYQVNKQMGNMVSPDIRKDWNRDLYTHLAGGIGISHERTWGDNQTFTVAIRDTFFINDYVAILENVARADSSPIELSPNDAAVKASIRIMTKEGDYQMQPLFLIKDGMLGMPVETLDELGIRLSFANIDPKKGVFTFNVNTSQKDFVVLKALEKPFINFLWIGVLVVVLGFVLSVIRRAKEIHQSKTDKELVAAE